MRNRIERFYREHGTLVNLLLIALVLRMAYLNLAPIMVFDETFYVHAAQSVLASGTDPNTEHPPLVKLIIAGSIGLFGDNPLSWRVPAVVMGIASIAFFYFVVLEVSKSKKLAFLSAALLTLDPLHIVMSRTAMLDIFMLGFAMVGAYFALRKDFLFAGIFFGLAAASKVPGLLIFAALSLFLYLKRGVKPPEIGYMAGLIGLIYLLVSAPFIVSTGPAEWLSAQINNAGWMATMKSGNEMTSTAIQWLYLQKPVWFTWDRPGFSAPQDAMFLVDVFGGKPDFGIVALGNPFFWVPGLLALGWIALQKAKKMSSTRLFALLWFACTYVPLLLLPRTHTAIYYMVFIIPAYALALAQFLETGKWAKYYLVVLAASVVFLLPIILGIPAPQPYFDFLRPLIGSPPNWNFT